MGVLSIYFKSSFLGLLKFMNSINWFIVFFSLINLSVCIYEDQIGKFDWRQTYVGRIKFAQFDTVSAAKKIIVATEENVLAALNLKTGQVVWRHVFESTSSGNIQLLHFTDKVVTVTGSNPYLVRGWDSATGVLLWEWSLALNNEKAAELSEWWVQQGLLVHMLPIFGSHIEVTTYNLLTGQNRGVTSKLPAVWTNAGCALSPPYYSCVSGNEGSELLLSLDVTSNAIQIITKPLSNYINGNNFEGNLRPLSGNSAVPGFIVDDKKLVMIVNNEFKVASVEVADSSASVSIIADGSSDKIIIQTWDDDIKGFSLIAHHVVTGQEVSEIRCFDRDVEVPELELNAVVCTKSAKNQHICRLLVTGADDSLHLMQQEGRILWTREEALANVVAAEFVDLPVSELDAAIESEFDQKEGSIWAAFSRRIHTQLQQLHTLLLSLHQTDSSRQDSKTSLVKDYFNLHKIIVLVTDVGKIFGMDNLSGAIVWSRYEPSLDAENVLVFNRRSARHPPHDAYISILGKQAENGNGLVVSLNPISGSLVGERVLPLDVQVVQAALLHVEDEDRLHALLLLDDDETVQILPVSAAPLVQNMFMYVAERDTGKVKGYALRYDGKSVVAQRTWTVELGGGDAGTGTRVVAAATRTGGSYSPGKALGDRSVLYKYDNPNMVLFITQGPDPLHKDVVTAVVVDAVSGAVIAAQTHRRATATKHAIHADNFFAYVYYNDKHRRTELATLEVYEGKQRWTSGGAFSSLGTALAPGAERRAYVAGGADAVRAAAVSRTGRDLTERHLLLALAGGVAEVPWAALEATPGPAPSVDVPLAAEAVLSYNRTLHRLTDVHVAPSGLESTCLVLATGLDLFYTRVAPSKTFDLLKDDFDYYLITIVLAALVISSYATKYFASRKMLRQAWK